MRVLWTPREEPFIADMPGGKLSRPLSMRTLVWTLRLRRLLLHHFGRSTRPVRQSVILPHARITASLGFGLSWTRPTPPCALGVTLPTTSLLDHQHHTTGPSHGRPLRVIIVNSPRSAPLPAGEVSGGTASPWSLRACQPPRTWAGA